MLFMPNFTYKLRFVVSLLHKHLNIKQKHIMGSLICTYSIFWLVYKLITDTNLNIFCVFLIYEIHMPL